jgi:hypothetical protein
MTNPEYLDHVPRKLPLGKAPVHAGPPAQWENQIPGTDDFRAWTVTRLQAAKE